MRNSYFILRHGQTPYQLKKEKIIYPWPEKEPILLTKKGKKQIEKVAQSLKKEKIDLIFSSDRARARQTAEIVAQKLKISKVIFDSRLGDINVGIFQGEPLSKYRSYFSSPKEWFLKAPPQGESLKDVGDRMLRFLKDLERNYQGKKILIISHGDPLLLLEGKVKRKSEKEILKEKLEKKNIKVGELRKL